MPIEGSVKDVNDGTQATLYGNTSFVADRFGNTNSALSLNGSGSYAKFPDAYLGMDV